jgi:hypothetical protein
MRCIDSARRVLLAVVLVSGCTFHTRTITSDPSGATILSGPSSANLKPAGQTTPFVWRDLRWQAWCFQALLPGYYSGRPQCLDGGAEDQVAHFELQPLESVGNPAAASSSAAFAAPGPREVFVTAGSISQAYEVLGPVHFDTVGMVNLGSSLSDALFKSRFERQVSGATPTLRQDAAFEKLRDAAIGQYGGAVHAVINATYRAEHSGTVFVDGLAVRFVAPAATPTASASAPSAATRRLEELKDLLSKKLITQKEYEKKRAEILKDL